MATFKVEGEIIKGFGKNIKRTRTIKAETEQAAIEEYKKAVLFTDHAIPHVNYVSKLAEKDPIKTSEKLTALPAEIRAKVDALLSSHRIRKFGFELTSKITLSEDITYYAWTPENGWNRIKMGGEWGGYKTGVAGSIGSTISLPVGSFVVEDQIFCGKYFVRVYHNNGQAQVR